MVVISYLYFVCFYFGGACSETACCGMGTQGFSEGQSFACSKKCALLAAFNIFKLAFLLDCPALLVEHIAPFSEHLDH